MVFGRANSCHSSSSAFLALIFPSAKVSVMQNPAPSPSASQAKYDDTFFEDDLSPAVSWSAITGGTFSALALTLILVGLGSGLGFASAASFQEGNISGAHFTAIAAAWLIIVQWLSSGLGGYLTGRLRTKWTNVHSHEVFFRDTAHGFVTWAVTTVISTLIVFMIASSAIHHAKPMMGDGHVGAAANAGPASYYIDKLFRRSLVDTEAYDNAKMEATPIIMKAMHDQSVPDEDRLYLGELVASHTGLDAPTAQKKVDDTLTQLRQATEQGEKTAASVAIYSFLSMLIGAFIACVAAALGGQRRDTPYPHDL